MNSIAIIVIGLNEEKNLEKCLNAVTSQQVTGYNIDVVYVDSGSTDKSVEIAETYPEIKIEHLNDPHPSAAKARNLGVIVTKSDYIQFIDGDSVLEQGWLKNAVPVLESNNDIGVVFGSINEIGQADNVYMKVCRFDWYMPPGDYRLCGGNALWKRSVLDEVGLFDGDLLAGEEPDLCYRVRQHKYRIVCLDRPIVNHDLDMNSFKDYWQRSVRSGTAYAIIAMRYIGMREKLWLREVIRNYIEVIIFLLIITIGFMYSWLSATTIFIVITLYRITKVMMNVKHRAQGYFDAFLYALHIQFSRFPLVYGQILGQYKMLIKSFGAKK